MLFSEQSRERNVHEKEPFGGICMKKHFTKKVVLTVLSLLFMISLLMVVSACGGNDNPPAIIEVTSVSLSQSELSLEIGESETLTATLSPDNATDKSVTWESSNTSVATVSDGRVTAVSVGNATITVSTNNGKTATCSVAVTNSTVETFRFLDDFDYAPSLVFREGAGFHNENFVAYATNIFFVMGFDFNRTVHNLLVKRMLNSVFDGNNDSFVHFIAGYKTDLCFSEVSFAHLNTLPFLTTARRAVRYRGSRFSLLRYLS